MHIRPVDLPELRAEIVRQRDAVGPAGIASLHTEQNLSRVAPGLGSIDVAARETTKLVLADLFHVSEGMTQLATVAAGSLPPFASDALDYPSSIGFMFFDGGIPVTWGKMPCRVHAASWQVLGTGAMIAFFIDLQSVLDELDSAVVEQQLRILGATPGGLWFNDIVRLYAGFNAGVSDHEIGLMAAESGVANSALPVLRAAMLLMQQPLAALSDVQPDRAAQKRLRRAGQVAKPVRVIELRRPKRTEGQGDGVREYHHSWIVRGHWRQQWYPTREVHRPLWIAPHIKGPEDAPLIGGEKVYALKR
ncbi:hypothetical protein ACFRCG_39770 [Embleya sp. NPDC056575]|uniref:hypothetical protein n=1 Tax=unclassified Embleya TaxID=2699296 RepID=UPI0036807702